MLPTNKVSALIYYLNTHRSITDTLLLNCLFLSTFRLGVVANSVAKLLVVGLIEVCLIYNHFVVSILTESPLETIA